MMGITIESVLDSLVIPAIEATSEPKVPLWFAEATSALPNTKQYRDDWSAYQSASSAIDSATDEVLNILKEELELEMMNRTLEHERAAYESEYRAERPCALDDGEQDSDIIDRDNRIAINKHL
jgi:hypothetical protein